MNNWFKNNSESMQWKWVGWLGAGMVIFGYYLNANEYIASWLVWMVGNTLVGIYSLYKKAYSTTTATLDFDIFCEKSKR